jgi:hypothetical protein
MKHFLVLVIIIRFSPYKSNSTFHAGHHEIHIPQTPHRDQFTVDLIGFVRPGASVDDNVLVTPDIVIAVNREGNVKLCSAPFYDVFRMA